MKYKDRVKDWRRRHLRWWLVYLVSAALPFVAAAILMLRIAFPITVSEWLNNFVDQAAMAEVIGTVGTTAIVIAWLINVAGQTVCGKRISELAQWAYPGFFYYYFFCFLANFFLGIYIANGRQPHRFATALIALSLAIGVIFIGRVCYVFVINQRTRERVAYAYYREALRYRAPFFAGNQKRAAKARANFRAASEQALLSLTEYVAQTEATGGALPFTTIFELWKDFIKNYREAFQEPENVLSLGCCSLAERFWDALIKAQPYEPIRSGFLLYVVTKAEDGLYRDHLLAGLLLRMKRAHRADDHGWDRECELLFQLSVRSQETGEQMGEQTGERCQHALQKLVLGLSMIMAVEALLEVVDTDFSRLQEMARRVALTSGALGSTNEGKFLRMLWQIYGKETGYESGVHSATQGWIAYPRALSKLLQEKYRDVPGTVVGADADQVRRASVCWALGWMDVMKKVVKKA